MDMQAVGKQIAALRRAKGLTQNDLGERLGVSFQAVSKWERGESLPDTALLPELSDALETTVDNILSGGRKALSYRGKTSVSDVVEGLHCLRRMGELLGRDNQLYRCAIQGIDEKMNTSIEDAFSDDYIFECFVAEAVIQNLTAGAYLDPTDVKKHFKYDHFRDIVSRYAAKHGIR